MNEEILKVFDMFSENASTEELKDLIKDIKELYKENFRLHSIIKEVIEYIKSRQNTLYEIRTSEILAILDKENKE